MAKFKAPEHVSAISTFAGERRCDKKGIITVEDGADAAEIAAILAAGFVAVADEPAEAPTAKAKSKA